MAEYLSAYDMSLNKPEKFWAEIAENFSWNKKWDSVLKWNFKDPDIKWFDGGELNITINCLDRHLESNGETTAIIFEPNDPDGKVRKLTYRELHAEVCKAANMLKASGINKGDRVCIYLPMIPEAVISMLACARIGAVHSVVFGGFSAKSLTDRINDSSCKLLITADGGFRGAKTIPLKQIADQALNEVTCIEKVIVYRHTSEEIEMQSGRDFWWQDELSNMPSECEPVNCMAEDMLFILYTSGSTGKPKGVVHTVAGYMIWTWYTFLNVFQYEKNDIFWCTADVGWITGHSYVTYGPLLSGATIMMYEGLPAYPEADRFWKVIEKHKVNIFYTAPTAIRSLMAYGDDFVKPYTLGSLKTLGSVGEPINEEAWHWFHEKVGRKRCSLTDTWWQTETGGIMIAPLAGITPEKPSYATLPLPGVSPVLVNATGEVITEDNAEGNLCINFPWPGMIRTTYGDHERCRQNYFASFPGYYFTGDGCRRDHDGNYRIIGRVDDVINVSGHRIGTAEVENAIDEDENVIESAVVGYPHEVKGQGIYAFVICDHDPENAEQKKKEILQKVTEIIGPIAKPDKIQFVSGLPKTRSGKIMRRILRKIAEGDISNLGDTSTLLDPGVVDEISKGSLKN